MTRDDVKQSKVMLSNLQILMAGTFTRTHARTHVRSSGQSWEEQMLLASGHKWKVSGLGRLECYSKASATGLTLRHARPSSVTLPRPYLWHHSWLLQPLPQPGPGSPALSLHSLFWILSPPLASWTSGQRRSNNHWCFIHIFLKYQQSTKWGWLKRQKPFG